MTPYVPPGWPAGVHPQGSEEFEQSAVAWLFEVVPPDYLLHGVLRRHPLALAALARRHLNACVEGARDGYRTTRCELGPHLPPGAVEAVLAAYRSEGSRLAAAARAADLVERALHGEVFVPQMGGIGRGSGRPGPGRAPSTGPSADTRTANVTAPAPARTARQNHSDQPTAGSGSGSGSSRPPE